MAGGKNKTLIVERLADLGAWELYLFSLERSGDTVCKVAMRPVSPEGVEYGVFAGEEGEPTATGVIPQRGGWSDEAREQVLEEIVALHRDRVSELRGRVVFDLYSEREVDVDDDDDEEDD